MVSQNLVSIECTRTKESVSGIISTMFFSYPTSPFPFISNNFEVNPKQVKSSDIASVDRGLCQDKPANANNVDQSWIIEHFLKRV